jgi:hypothetical protein
MSYAGSLDVDHLETHFCPLVEQAAYFFLGHIVNSPPAVVPSLTKSDSDLGYYDLPTNQDDDVTDHAVSGSAHGSSTLIPEIYPSAESGEFVESLCSGAGADVFECVESMKLSSAEKCVLDGFVFTLANLLHDLCTSLRPEMTLLNLAKVSSTFSSSIT